MSRTSNQFIQISLAKLAYIIAFRRRTDRSVAGSACVPICCPRSVTLRPAVLLLEPFLLEPFLLEPLLLETLLLESLALEPLDDQQVKVASSESRCSGKTFRRDRRSNRMLRVLSVELIIANSSHVRNFKFTNSMQF